jgi:hypothetical protein
MVTLIWLEYPSHRLRDTPVDRRIVIGADPREDAGCG